MFNRFNELFESLSMLDVLARLDLQNRLLYRSLREDALPKFVLWKGLLNLSDRHFDVINHGFQDGDL